MSTRLRGNPEPRAHHFTPQCWLAGFTADGTKEGCLWVTDLKRQKQWPTTPPNAGHRRDFYRLAEPSPDPVAFERLFSLIENMIAPVLRNLYAKPQEPDVEEMDALLYFAAIQFIRVPAFRPWLLKIEDSIQRDMIADALKSRASWEETMKKAGIPSGTLGAEYDRMLAFEEDVIKKGQYTLSAENDFFLLRGFKAATDKIYPLLKARHWRTLISPTGSFTGSDNPVVMDGPKSRMIGFKSAEIVIFTINRFVALYGTTVPAHRPLVNRPFIASHNTFTMLTANEQLYSHIPDFCWLDSDRHIQTDWRLFNKNVISEALGTDRPPVIDLRASRRPVADQTKSA